MKIAKLVLLLCCAVFLSLNAYAEDPLKVAPGKYKLLLENDRVRVLEVQIAVGDSIAAHSHPDHVAYAASACTLTITGEDGKAMEAALKQGEALWLPATTHSAVNKGKTACRVAVVELKEAPKM